jgi:preprotein translocase subunit YajC
VPFFLQPWPLLIVLGLMFYFIMIRPERQRRSQMTQMLDNLKKNDRVVTIGGIYGVVVNLQKDTPEVTIRVDEGTNSKLRVRRSAISEVLTAETDEKKEAG